MAAKMDPVKEPMLTDLAPTEEEVRLLSMPVSGEELEYSARSFYKM